jgi:hypothetical protein
MIKLSLFINNLTHYQTKKKSSNLEIDKFSNEYIGILLHW